MAINNFDVLKEMGIRDMDMSLAPLDNIINLRKTKHGTQITIGVAGDLVAAIGLEHKYCGGLILADKQQFDTLKCNLQQLPVVRSRADIEAEIETLKPIAKDYDTELQSDDTCVAVGAYDALLWVLGREERSVSDHLKDS